MKSYLHTFIICLVLLYMYNNTSAQTPVGPNSPSMLATTFGLINGAMGRPTSESGGAAPGTGNWTASNNTGTSNDQYATTAAVATPATPSATTAIIQTRLMFHKDFGFAINPALFVQGIQVEYEKGTVSDNIVANNPAFIWDTGYYYSPAILAGKNRTLFLAIFAEDANLNSTTITTPTIAGQTMTFVDEYPIPNGSGSNIARVFIYRTTDAGCAAIAAATPGNRRFIFTLSPQNANEHVEIVASAMFNNVDQIFPVLDQEDHFGTNITANPALLQLDVPLTTEIGGVTILAGMTGSAPTGSPNVWTNNISYNTVATYVDGIDVYNSNPATSGSGATAYTGHNFTAASGTEQPTISMLTNGNVNRMFVYAMQLTRAKEYDRQVYLIRNNVYQDGSPVNPLFNRALNNVGNGWPLTDTYFAHGGPNDKWGRVPGYYTIANVNDPDFGAAISATVQNGSARIDHVRITVYTSTTLPIDLLSFKGTVKNNTNVLLNWETATEINNKVFEIERSLDGEQFYTIGQIDGAGNSNEKLSYNYTDENLAKGFYYYRIKQTDFDGTFSYSSILAQELKNGIIPSAKIYPNPSASGIFYVINNVSMENNTFNVYNNELKLIRTSNSLNNIDLSSEPDGTYYFIQQIGDSKIIQKMMKYTREK